MINFGNWDYEKWQFPTVKQMLKRIGKLTLRFKNATFTIKIKIMNQLKPKFLGISLAIIYGLVSLLGFVFAYMYLFRPEFMPYHAVAVGRDWSEVANEYQVLILALMRVSGGGWLGVATGILICLIAFIRTGKSWTHISVLLIGLSGLVPTLMATLMVKNGSPANPPWYAAAIGIGVLVIAFILSFFIKKKS